MNEFRKHEVNDIHEANFGFKRLTSTDAKNISDHLAINHTWKMLNLWNNYLGDVGIKYLCDALFVNTYLSCLDLESAKFGDEGAKYLSMVISTNSTLMGLNLSNNEFGDEGVKYLSDALKINTSLINISLRHNNIGDVGAKYIGDALSVNTTLVVLDLSYNKISPIIISSFPNRNGDAQYVVYKKLAMPHRSSPYSSLVCHVLDREDLETLIHSGDKSQIVNLTVDGTYFKYGVIPLWVSLLPNLKSLRFT